ncbi:MAG: D-tyrosyl-tRNA(Tyr) deacylase [Burkholderiales bacterium]|jgi:D-tyrosyl-tRNA(Tyr) deacylase|nr:D-tyrosyl-tRNA(Tyr) deacylase [Burkholderiales bacterium]
MRILLQRVTSAKVDVDGKTVGQISYGLLALVGITEGDSPEDADWLCKKIAQSRIFDDENGVMNRSLTDIGGDVLAVSQFTLYASTRKGNRPSYTAAARPEFAQPFFDAFVKRLAETLGKPVPTGVFGAMMQVSLVNDGPVTLWLDSRNRE